MSSKKSKTSRGTEKTANRHRRRESCKALEQTRESSTDVLPPNATTTASAERSGVATCDPGDALKADATQKVTDDCPEAGTASTGVENRAGNIVELWSTDTRLARPQSSTETHFPRVEPMPSQPPPTTVADLVSASHRVRNVNAAGGQLNAEDSRDQGPHTTDSPSRERLIVHEMATTATVQETVSPPKEGCHEGNATKSQEGAALSPQSTVSPLSTLSPDNRTTVTAEGTYASPGVLGSVMTSSVSPVSDGSLDKASGPLPAPSTATGQAAGAQEGNPEGGTVTEGPPVSLTGPMAAATTIEVRTTVLEADQKGLKVAQPTIADREHHEAPASQGLSSCVPGAGRILLQENGSHRKLSNF
ncbi:uncharacterized protein LOC119458911 [Dermacentor silvarum]|uniref:uncharacterized protein LOC119458911 n=1 Tax=Dermacentor silvarum TaxID=543639 RepID=UPI00189ACB2A|nr:uncharacterized protein LOC119458911 [Dermacentor silvarum]